VIHQQSVIIQDKSNSYTNLHAAIGVYLCHHSSAQTCIYTCIVRSMYCYCGHGKIFVTTLFDGCHVNITCEFQCQCRLRAGLWFHQIHDEVQLLLLQAVEIQITVTEDGYKCKQRTPKTTLCTQLYSAHSGARVTANGCKRR
jgi:hypothetical protein